MLGTFIKVLVNNTRNMQVGYYSLRGMKGMVWV